MHHFLGGKKKQNWMKSWVSAGGVAIFPRVRGGSSNMHGNRGGSMFDRAGRGLDTPHPLFSLWKHIVQRGLSFLTQNQWKPCCILSWLKIKHFLGNGRE